MRLALLAVVAGAVACEAPHPDWERMVEQKKVKPQEGSAFFADGRGMRTPPEGTVPRSRIVGAPVLSDGVTAEGGPVAVNPLPVTRELLERGRNRFDIFCATCHGVAGDGNSDVAENMTLRPPPSLHSARVRELPPGDLFRAVTRGYGLMPAYAAYVSVEDRWAIVAYVGALQLSQSYDRRALSPELQREAEGVLR